MNQQAPIIYLKNSRAPAHTPVCFNKKELGQILNIYGKMVSAGLWRDYGLEQGVKTIAFNVFKRSSDQPIYRIQKNPSLVNKQGAFAILGQGGVTLKRGHSLETLLQYFNKKLIKAVN